MFRVSDELCFTLEELIAKLEAMVRATADSDLTFGPDTPSTAEILDQLAEQILSSDDLYLVELHHRAVKAFNHLSEHKAQPVLIYNKHYRAPDFQITDTKVHLRVHSTSRVEVTTELSVRRNAAAAAAQHLVLDAENQRVLSVWLDDVEFVDFNATHYELILNNVSFGAEDNQQQQRTVRVRVLAEINPLANTSGEGLYVSQGVTLTTQCESQGARKIFPCIDRPDVLSVYTTTIVADANQYPVRVSNGNLVAREKKVADEGLMEITYHDQFPKPSYLFACVLGNFAVLEDTFVTETNKRPVKLSIYVPPGQEERGRYALFATKKSMFFDEHFFDREYDLNELKQVAMPDFNAGAMENKGLIIYNADSLLVDPKCGSDGNYRRVAHVICHEYCHNWSGNRVTVRNWFELALKEAFTEMRSVLFMEWMFGADLIRPDSVHSLRNYQFPQDASPQAHPIMVESFYNSDSIYDGTTYTKGAEVFRMLRTIINAENGPSGFKLAQNAYFSKYDGMAVTFRELLTELQSASGCDLTQFERWFDQAGTPEVHATLQYDADDQRAILVLKQTCVQPATKQEQRPFDIPFSVELLSRSGDVLVERHLVHMKEREMLVTFESVREVPIPVFQHDYTAPIKLRFEHSDADLMTIVANESDPFAQWDAGQSFSLRLLQQLYTADDDDEGTIKVPQAAVATYRKALESDNLSALSKVNLLQLPSIRAIVSDSAVFDFPKAASARKLLKKTLATELEPVFVSIREQYPEPQMYDPTSDSFPRDIQVRSLRNTSLAYLVLTGKEEYLRATLDQFDDSKNFNNHFAALRILSDLTDARAKAAMDKFYQVWRDDVTIFSKWIVLKAMGSTATPATLTEVRSVVGYQHKNPNHMRSLYRAYAASLAVYHDNNNNKQGDGYRAVTDAILELSKVNPHVVAGIATTAYKDYARLPAASKQLMQVQLTRLQADDVPDAIVSLATRILKGK